MVRDVELAAVRRSKSRQESGTRKLGRCACLVLIVRRTKDPASGVLSIDRTKTDPSESFDLPFEAGLFHKVNVRNIVSRAA